LAWVQSVCGTRGLALGYESPAAPTQGLGTVTVRLTARTVIAEHPVWEAPMTDRLLELEEQGWRALSSPDPVKFCEEWLAGDAVLIVPGMVIDRGTFLKALADEQPWARHHIEEPRVVQVTDDSAALVYRVTAQREGQPEFAALMTSVYVKRADRWQLVLHQQTPMATP
jgi:hypothetical protein